MPFRIGPMELVIVLVIVLIIFGAGKLPEIGGSMGKAIREFRKGTSSSSSKKDLLAESDEDNKTAS